MESYPEHTDHTLITIRVNLDDMNPEWMPSVLDLLLDAGAKDAFYIPVIMKKGRPGYLLEVLADEQDLEVLENLIFKHTTTLGIRYFKTSIHRLGRTFQEVETPWGMVSVKLGYLNETCVQVSPEYEECRKLSEKSGTPLPEIYAYIRKAIELS